MSSKLTYLFANANNGTKGIRILEVNTGAANIRIFNSGLITDVGKTNFSFGFITSSNPPAGTTYHMVVDARKSNGNHNFNNKFFTLDNISITHQLSINELACTSYSDYRYGFNGMEKDDEIKGSGNSYDFGARMYDSRLGRWLSIDAHTSKYSSHSPYNYAVNSPLAFSDENGDDVILIIWATANGEIGHAAIAVSNYKTIKVYSEVQGKRKISYETVPDGTYTYYDNWPSNGVNLSGLKGAMETVPAYRSHDKDKSGVIISDMKDFTESNITEMHPLQENYNESGKLEYTGIPNEKHAQDGVMKIETSYYEDAQIKTKIEQLNTEKKNYTGTDFNCSTFCIEALSPVLGPKLDMEAVLGLMGMVTPNALWRDTEKTATENYTVVILVDPGLKVNNTYYERHSQGNSGNETAPEYRPNPFMGIPNDPERESNRVVIPGK